ncbi:ROK family protein [Corynebacterium epidermidicanis]|uniref:Transcriptional regulator/sugar kinase n=1 Tax=Corynebacterium epidermidicanis TaxID=1050174 RepID=A0A0G3GYB0_9CORY|nr:ROK family protein [Corynebacterium epidermidicanis]AKK03842.1 transcriptional regulator/sugar kinase [Corynebacterium epidermidicanis]
MTHFLAGVDIGGTKIATALIDATQPTKIVFRHRTATPRTDVMVEVLREIRTLKEQAQQLGGELVAVGIGAPGVVDPHEGYVVSAGPTMPGWAGTAIKASVIAEFGLPTAVHNDVRIMGLGEAVYGAGGEYTRPLFLSLGTGVGGALIYSGKLIESPHHTAGELRNILGRRIDGAVAPIEEFASGPGLARSFFELSGEKIELPEIMERYHAGDSTAIAVLDGNLRNLGEALAGFASAIDIDALIVGGGVSKIGEPIMRPLTEGFRQHALAPIDTIPIKPAELGTDAPLVGAAYLAAQAWKGQ